MKETLKINGHDYSHLIVESGIQWKFSALDSEDSGRTTMDGIMHRHIVRFVFNGEVKLKPLTQKQIEMVMADLNAAFFEAEYISPRYGLNTATFYTNNIQMTLDRVEQNGEYRWIGVSFPLIER